MRLKKLKLIVFITVLILVVSPFNSTIYADQEHLILPEGFEKVAEKGPLVLVADKKSGEFGVIDSTAGTSWWSNPSDRNEDNIAKGIQKMDLNSQLLITFVNLPDRSISYVNTFTGSVNKGGAVYSAVKDGFRIEYTFPDKQCRIPLEIKLCDGYVQAAIPVDEMEESETEAIYSISLLPFFGAGSKQMNGYMFVPDGSGALIYYNNNKQTLDEYKQPLYGKDLAYNMLFRGNVEQDAKLPVFGAQNESSGFLAVITDGDAHGTVNARVSGAKSSYNTVFTEFSLRTSDMYEIGNDNQLMQFDKNRANLKEIKTRYYLLPKGNCDYNAMALKYRDYLENEAGLKPKEPKPDMPFFIELYGAIRKTRNVLGIPMNSVQPLSTYSSSLDLLKKINSMGVADIVFKYTNANRDNIKGTYLAKYRPDSVLGSRSQLIELMDYCKSNNIVYMPNADLLNFSKSSLTTTVFFDAVRTLSGSVAMQNKYQLSTDRVDMNKDVSYLITPSKLLSRANGFAESLEKLGFSNVSLDTLGNILYSSFYKSRSSRQQSLEAMRRTVNSIREKTGSIMMSDANSYMLPYVDYVEDSPQNSSGFDLIDEYVPFYHMVLSGLVYYSAPAVNFSSDPGKAVLTAIENGSALKYTWVSGDASDIIDSDYMYLYGADYRAWIESAAADYKKVNEVYKKTGGTRIVHHRIISEGVRETTYENGTRVFVNYNNTPVTVDGKYSIESESYIVK